MRIEQKTTSVDGEGNTRIAYEIVIAPSYRPGQALEMEAQLQAEFNKMACLAMAQLLSTYDTCGEPITRGGIDYTSKGRSPATYQCCGGSITLERHVYQNSSGGRTYCPLEEHGRIVAEATPHFAKVTSSLYATQSGRAVLRHLKTTLQRSLSLDCLQSIASACGKAALAQEKARPYAYQTEPDRVEAIVALADATCTAIVDEGWKHVAAGAFVLLDGEGERLETIYLANAPEDSKTTFWQRMDQEAERLREHFPDVPWFGLCDGATDIQTWLEAHCDMVTLDFYHLSEYVAAAKPAFGEDAASQDEWYAGTLHDLKHSEGSAEKLLGQLKTKAQSNTQPAAFKEELLRIIGYMQRNLERMEYALLREEHLPIGSGVIEAACKTVVKQRSNLSGARWKRKGLQRVLALRSLWVSGNRLDQFWQRCALYGY